MGIQRDRDIDRAVREVDALETLVQIIAEAVARLEERVKGLEDENRQRSADGGNRRGKRELLRDG